MRKVTNEENIPYLSKSIRYYEAYGSRLLELNQDVRLIEQAYSRAKHNESKIYFTWHGQYRTDVFEVDDLQSLGLAFGFEQSDHVHEIEWRLRYPDERGSYATVDVKFKCGCVFEGGDDILRLSAVLKSIYGWEVSKSYLGGYNGRYTVRVLKSSMCNEH